MFVNVRDPLAPDRKHRPFTEKYTDLWRSMLRNNHVVSEVLFEAVNLLTISVTLFNRFILALKGREIPVL
ncbi:hypothetical protein DICVIV_07402 [Dictyocaulus viviparus]|uniref:Uncharacterized protein n=1 Tax=Dictyocaulus viviparus TaxID=29172 RepID=A0A0D8XS02_DICVI|nr:hypothetical protein DICVIV_07402 [Dictyocaulus viviparus]